MKTICKRNYKYKLINNEKSIKRKRVINEKWI
jgi:hypothetical protein